MKKIIGILSFLASGLLLASQEAFEPVAFEKIAAKLGSSIETQVNFLGNDIKVKIYDAYEGNPSIKDVLYENPICSAAAVISGFALLISAGILKDAYCMTSPTQGTERLIAYCFAVGLGIPSIIVCLFTMQPLLTYSNSLIRKVLAQFDKESLKLLANQVNVAWPQIKKTCIDDQSGDLILEVGDELISISKKDLAVNLVHFKELLDMYLSRVVQHV